MAYLTAKQEEHRGYTQLTREERYQIFILKKDNYSQTEIADLPGRDKSTISRELRCNRGLKGYRPKQEVETLIREAWSPEQIVGQLEMEQEDPESGSS